MSAQSRNLSKEQRFWDRLAAKYASDPISDEAAYQTKLDITRRHFSPEMEVLEFGCGTGMTAVSHAPFVKHIHATDLSGEMLEIARGRAAEAGVENISFERAGFEEIETIPERYDVVLGLSILHLLEDRYAAIARVHSLLKPGGVFISSTPCLGEKMWYVGLIAPVAHFFGLFPLLRIFTAKQLVKSLQQAGFEVEHQWRPDKAVAVFIVARKPAN